MRSLPARTPHERRRLVDRRQHRRARRRAMLPGVRGRTGKQMTPLPREAQDAVDKAVCRILERRHPGCSAYVIVREDERENPSQLRGSRQHHGPITAPHDMNPVSDHPAAAA
jgi:hypothetical protein